MTLELHPTNASGGYKDHVYATMKNVRLDDSKYKGVRTIPVFDIPYTTMRNIVTAYHNGIRTGMFSKPARYELLVLYKPTGNFVPVPDKECVGVFWQNSEAESEEDFYHHAYIPLDTPTGEPLDMSEHIYHSLPDKLKESFDTLRNHSTFYVLTVDKLKKFMDDWKPTLSINKNTNEFSNYYRPKRNVVSYSASEGVGGGYRRRSRHRKNTKKAHHRKRKTRRHH
jgi:hypothetical protein